MNRDPIVEEVRAARKEIEAHFQNDAGKYFEHLQRIQKQYASRLVRRKSKPALAMAV